MPPKKMKLATVLIDVYGRRIYDNDCNYDPDTKYSERFIHNVEQVLSAAHAMAQPIFAIDFVREGTTAGRLERFTNRLLHKTHFSMFSGTDIEEQLRDENVTDIIVLGGYASVCAYRSAHEAHEKGFNIHSSSDVLYGWAHIEHGASSKKVIDFYADHVTMHSVQALVDFVYAGDSHE